MARKLPAYVRLPAEGEVLPVGILADIDGGTGWSISGLDVKETPDDDDPAQKFVRTALNAGRLEEATKDEFDAVQAAHKELAKLAPDSDSPKPWNEPAIAQAARRLRRKLVSSRRDGKNDVGDEDAPYDKRGVDELRAELDRRGLDTEGKKADLVTRLEEDDANK